MTRILIICHTSKLHIMPVHWGKEEEHTEFWTPSEYLQVRK